MLEHHSVLELNCEGSRVVTSKAQKSGMIWDSYNRLLSESKIKTIFYDYAWSNATALLLQTQTACPVLFKTGFAMHMHFWRQNVPRYPSKSAIVLLESSIRKKKDTFDVEYFLLWSRSSSEHSLHHHTHLAKIISSRLSVPWDTHQSLYQIYRRISCLMLLDVQQCYIASPYTCSPSTFKLWFSPKIK